MSAAAIAVATRHEVPGPAASKSGRTAALEELRAAGWPTRRRERWRYTDLEPLGTASFELTPGAAGAADVAALEQLLAARELGNPDRQLVLLDGQRVTGLGATTLPGVVVDTPEENWSEFEARFARRLAATHHPLAALNTAFTQRGLWLRISAHQRNDEPIHLVVASSRRAGVAAQPRIVVELEEGAQATLVQHFIDCDTEALGWTNSVTQLELAPRSRLKFYRLQRHGKLRTHTSLLSAVLAEHAALEAGYFDLGGKLVRNDITIDLVAAGARTELFGLLLAQAGQHVDDHTTIEHSAGETLSRENFRGIIGERGRGVFNGRVVVKRGSQRIDAQQTNDNLLLGEHAEIDTKPELEIYANDVRCGHGSTVGELDDEHLFYLRTRGLDDAAARRILTSAFAATVVELVRDDDVRNHVSSFVAARLESLTG